MRLTLLCFFWISQGGSMRVFFNDLEHKVPEDICVDLAKAHLCLIHEVLYQFELRRKDTR